MFPELAFFVFSTTLTPWRKCCSAVPSLTVTCVWCMTTATVLKIQCRTERGCRPGSAHWPVSTRECAAPSNFERSMLQETTKQNEKPVSQFFRLLRLFSFTETCPRCWSSQRTVGSPGSSRSTPGAGTSTECKVSLHLSQTEGHQKRTYRFS